MKPRARFFDVTTILKLMAVGLMLTGVSAAQRDSSCVKDPARLEQKQWIAKAGLAHGPYKIPKARRTQLEGGHKKLRLGMGRKQVEELLGPPDFDQRWSTSSGPRSDHPDAPVICGVTWAYHFAKSDTNPYDMNDEALFLYFNGKDALVWVKPQNIALKEMGRLQ